MLHMSRHCNVSKLSGNSEFQSVGMDAEVVNITSAEAVHITARPPMGRFSGVAVALAIAIATAAAATTTYCLCRRLHRIHVVQVLGVAFVTAVAAQSIGDREQS